MSACEHGHAADICVYCARATGRRDGVAEERRRVVEWLRSPAARRYVLDATEGMIHAVNVQAVLRVARGAIERGEGGG